MKKTTAWKLALEETPTASESIDMDKYLGPHWMCVMVSKGQRGPTSTPYPKRDWKDPKWLCSLA